MAEPLKSTIEFDAAGFEAMARELAAALGKAADAVGDALRKNVKEASRKAGTDWDFKYVYVNFSKQADKIEARLKALNAFTNKIGVNPAQFGLINNNVEELNRLLHRAGTEAEAFKVDMNRVGAIMTQITAASKGGFLDLGQQNLLFRELRSQRETDAKLQDRLLRNQADREKSAASARIVAEQGTNARMIAQSKAANQRRVELFRAAVQQIRALERGLGAVFRFTARQIEAAFRGIGRSVSTSLAAPIRSAVTRSNSALTSGTQSALTRRESLFRSSFSRQESIVNSSISRQTATIQRFERQLSTGVAGAVTGRGAAGGLLGGGLLAGAAGGAGLGALLTSGFERFSQLETLNRQFTVLTGSAENAALMMQQVKDFAKITPFDLVGVAGLAKGFLAIGTATEDVLPQVKTIADAVAFTGGGTDALERIQRAIGQVVSAGRLQGDELNQLAENLPSLNIRKLLAEQLTGGDVAALVELQEAGGITAEMFVTGLMTGLSTDPRIANAAQDMANTLKGRFDNLKESFSDLGATIIGVFADELKTAFAALQTAFAGISQFIKGEDLSAGMQLLRTAAEGAAIALGGLLVVKLIAEGFQLLAVGLGALLTPFGIFITAIALIGAAFKVLSDASPALREQLERLGTIVGNVFDGIKDVVGAFLGTTGDKLGDVGAGMLTKIGDAVAGVLRIINNELAPFINVTVLPALKRFGEFLRNDVYPAVVNFLGDAAFFIVGTVIPRLKEFYNFLSGTLVPFLVDKVVGAFNAVKDVVDGLDFGKVARLGGIVAAVLGGFALGGPIGGILAGGGAALALVFSDSFREAVVGDLSDIASSIGDALKGPLETVGNAIRDFFSTDNLLDIAGGVIGFAETLGFTIGNILTDPRLVAGVAAFVGVAVAAAANFVKGLIRGIGDNLPGLYDLLKEAGGTALEFLVEGLTSGDVLMKAIPALLVGASLLGAWRSAGSQAGIAAGKGFFGSFKTNAFGGALAGGGTLTRGGGAGAFISSALFGAGGIEGAETRVKAQATRLTNAMARTLTIAGRSIQPAKGEGFANAVKRQFDQLATDIGPSGVTGLRFRNALKQLFTGNFRQFAADVQLSGRQIGRALATGVAGGFAGLQIGKQIGTAGGSGLDAALGIGGTALAIGAISGPAGIAAGALGVLGLALGETDRKARLATEGAKEYTDALRGLSGEAFRKAAETTLLGQLKKETDETRDALQLAGFEVADFVRGFMTGTTNVAQEISNIAFGIEAIDFANIIDEAGVTTMQEVLDLALQYPDAFEEFKLRLDDLGGANFEDIFGFINDEAGELNEGIQDLNRETLEYLGTTQETATGTKAAWQIIQDSIDSALGKKRKNEALEQAADDLIRVQDEAEDARQAVIDFLTGDYQNSLQQTIDEFITGLPALGTQIVETLAIPGEQLRQATLNQIGAAMSEDFIARVRMALVADPSVDPATIVADAKAEIQRALDAGEITAEAAATMNFFIDQTALSTDMQALLQALIDSGEIPSVSVAANGTVVFKDLEVSAEPITLEGQIALAIGAGQITPTIEGVENLFVLLREQARQMLLAQGPKDEAGNPQIDAGETAVLTTLDLQIAGLTPEEIAAIIKGALPEDPPVVDLPFTPNFTPVAAPRNPQGGGIHSLVGIPETAETIDLPVTVNVVATIGNEAAIKAVGGSVGNLIAQGILTAGLVISIAAIAVVNTGISNAALATGGAVAVGAALGANFARGIQAGIGVATGAARALGAAASAAVRVSNETAVQAGLDLARGLANGIRVGAVQAIAAARAMAQAVINITKAVMQTGSPSRVFHDIGIEAGRGFAEGMRESEGSMVSAASQAVSAAIEAAQTVAGQPRGSLIAGLFEAAQIQRGAAGFMPFVRGAADLAGIGERFRGALQQTAIDIWTTTTKAAAGEFIGAEERRLLGTSFQSLDVFDAAGARNVAAFLDLGEEIRNFVVSNLEAGRPPEETFAFAREARNRLVGTAAEEGLNLDTINFLIDQLGLSEEALGAFWLQVQNATAEAENHAAALEAAANAEKAAEEAAKAREEADKAAEEAKEAEIERLKELIRLAGINIRPIDVHVAPPFGDPEAIGLGVANRVAFGLAG